MKFFLCAHAIYPSIQEDFEDFVDSSMQELSVAFVTTAANQIRDKSWEGQDIELAKSIFNKVDIFDIEKMDRKEMFETFCDYDILWINGGETAYLMKRVRETGLEEILPEILDTGVIYVGSSSGSMIWSKSLEIAEWYTDDSEEGASKVPGMGVLDFQIYPHFEDSMLEDIKKNKKKDEEYWLLRNGQAISYNDGEIEKYGGDILILPRE